MARILLTFIALLSAVALATGCGNDGSSGSSGAASLAPAGAVIYGEATLDPSDEQQAAIDALIEKFPGAGSAGERIRRLLEKALSESDTGLSYGEDIEPWLGDQAGFFVSSFAPGGDASAAFMLATKDEGKSRDAIEKAAKANDGKQASYKGHDYYAISDGAAGVVDGWVVLGSEQGLKAAIETAEGGAPLEDDATFTETLADAPEERLGFVYFNTPEFAKQLQNSGAGFGLGPFADLFKDPVLATVNANENGVRVEATLPESLSSAFPIIGARGGAAAELPADSWLALAQPDLGKTISYFVDTFGALAGGRGALAQQLKGATGLDLDKDVIAWMGDWRVFVSGTSVDQLSGALVVDTTDEAASGRFIAAIARLAAKSDEGRVTRRDGGVTFRSDDVPEPIHLFQRDGKVVLAYGDRAAADAFDPGETLGETQGYKDAQAALGGDYDLSLYLSFEQIVELVDSTGAGDDEGWLRIKPYLEPLGALAVGAEKDGDQVRTALGISVR
jgi:hypothetical protein